MRMRIAIIGLGSLGSVSAHLLAQHGFDLTLIDRDVINEANLSRQLYTSKDIDLPKASVLGEKLGAKWHAVHFDHTQTHLLDDADIIVDGTDNLFTRYLIDDYSLTHKKPWIFGAAVGEHGMVATFDGTSLRQIKAQAQSLENCSTDGLINAMSTSIAALQVKHILDYQNGKPVAGLHLLNLQTYLLRTLQIPHTHVDFGEYLSGEKQQVVRAFCGGGRFQFFGDPIVESKLNIFEKFNGFWKGNIDGHHTIVFADGRVIIAAGSEQQARQVYDYHLG